VDPAQGRVPARRDQHVPYLRITPSPGKDHVYIMTNQARSTLKAPKPLGNSIRNLDWASCSWYTNLRTASEVKNS
jgi:hypothetical protein